MNTTLPIDTVIHGDALTVLKTIDSNSIDSLCCDPPAGINFMNKEFDSSRGGRDSWVKWLSEIMKECFRVLKNGAHGLIWSLPRQSHWTALALEESGFQIRDSIYNIVSGDTTLHNFIASLNEEQQHAFMQIIDGQREPSGILNIFGQGFPKSMAIDKAIERMQGIQRDLVPRNRFDGKKTGFASTGFINGVTTVSMQRSDEPMTEDSAKWRGYGTNLKPSVENWWLVRKPLAVSSIAENVLLYGVGGINIDACRVGWETGGMEGQERTSDRISPNPMDWGKQKVAPRDYKPTPQGRFPSHLLLTHTPACRQVGTKRVRGHTPGNAEGSAKADHPVYGEYQHHGNGIHYTDEDGMETVTNWVCPEWCPVRILDLQSGQSKDTAHKRASAGSVRFNGKYNNGELYNNSADQFGGYTDSGGASRYFQQFPALDDVPPYIYAGKASRKDRSANNTVQNTHPTVKNIELMKYMCRLLCPPNGIVLDCFAGSGSTGVACIHENFHYILIEREAEYIDIINKRIEHALQTRAIQREQSNQHSQSDTPSNHSPIIKDTTINKAPRKKQRKQQDTLQMTMWNDEVTA